MTHPLNYMHTQFELLSKYRVYYFHLSAKNLNLRYINKASVTLISEL